MFDINPVIKSIPMQPGSEMAQRFPFEFIRTGTG